MGAQFEIRIAHRNRNDRDVGTAFGIGLAAKSLAVAAILARAQLCSVRIGVRARSIGRIPAG